MDGLQGALYVNPGPFSAAFTIAPPHTGSAFAGGLMVLDASSTTSPVPVKQFWVNWGDGQSTSRANPYGAAHTYAWQGTYQVYLTVTDTLGNTSVATRMVSVGPAPYADILLLDVPPVAKTPQRWMIGAGTGLVGVNYRTAWRMYRLIGTSRALVASDTGRTVTFSLPDSGSYRLELRVTVPAAPATVVWRDYFVRLP